jgi:hypothetical protein
MMIRYLIASIGLILSIGACSNDATETVATPQTDIRAVAADDPLRATYTIEGERIRLVAGRAERQAAPGSATRVETMVFGDPVYGDLDGDGTDDAALVLVHQPGGSGTFYYVAAALAFEGAYRGTNAVLLGDRIAPKQIDIRNGVIYANYADRGTDEPMAVAPSVGKSTYLTIEDNRLTEIGTLAEADQLLEGWVTIGHEVRTFAPCSDPRDHWLLGGSPALQAIIDAHAAALPNAQPYTPLFMTLTGHADAKPSDGFGAQYDAAFLATQLVQVWPKGNCRSEFIEVESPLPGEVIDSPLHIRGRARGMWFFEGDFPVVLQDAGGRVIKEWYATAQGEWMTENFVPFTATLEFDSPGAGARGVLVLKKDDPSDRRELDDAIRVPVVFK